MGFSLTILIWAIPAILFVGLVATLFAAIRSRPGVQQGCRVNLRLRFVDAASLGCRAVTQLFVMLLWLMLPWREFFQEEVAPFWVLLGGFLLGGAFVSSLTSIMTIFATCYFFRWLGILTAVQAKYYPLQANKRRMDPWPLCWQEPCPRQFSSQAQADKMDTSAEQGGTRDSGGA